MRPDQEDVLAMGCLFSIMVIVAIIAFGILQVLVSMARYIDRLPT